jgi:hypothetical protein
MEKVLESFNALVHSGTWVLLFIMVMVIAITVAVFMAPAREFTWFRQSDDDESPLPQRRVVGIGPAIIFLAVIYIVRM